MGVLAHFSTFAMSALSIWIASLAATVSLIAFIFDMVVWNIASSRIKSAGGTASLGQANWMVLAAFILLALSGCAFGFGRRVVRKRPPRDTVEQNKPRIDDAYASEARMTATQAARHREQLKENGGGGGGLPPFADPLDEESIPLRTWEAHEENISGVGYGQRKDDGTATPDSSLNHRVQQGQPYSTMGGYDSYPVAHTAAPLAAPAPHAYDYRTPMGTPDAYPVHPTSPQEAAAPYGGQPYFPQAPYGQPYAYSGSPPVQPAGAGAYVPYPDRGQSPPQQPPHLNSYGMPSQPPQQQQHPTTFGGGGSPPISPVDQSIYSQQSGYTSMMDHNNTTNTVTVPPPLPLRAQEPLPMPGGEPDDYDGRPYNNNAGGVGEYDAVPPSYSSRDGHNNNNYYQQHGKGS
jgi:hypothetical protein